MTAATDDLAAFEQALNKAESAQWTERQILLDIGVTLAEILIELKRQGSERPSAVSSATIKTSTRGYDCEVKAYAGSEVPVDAALEAYGRMVREANERAMNGWAESVK